MFDNIENKCNLVVSEICNNMDAVVNTLSQYKNPQSINNLTDEQMYSAILEIGLVVYNMQVRLETVGIKSDVAKILLAYRQSYIKANMQGKVSDKENSAIIKSLLEQEDSVIYNRAYKIIKGKIDVAMELINSLKKIVSDRIENKKLAYGREYR